MLFFVKRPEIIGKNLSAVFVIYICKIVKVIFGDCAIIPF